MSLRSTIHFHCASCNSLIQGSLDVPSPNFSAEKLQDSQSYSEDSLLCPDCGREFAIEICNDYYHLYCSIPGVDQDDIEWCEPWDDDVDWFRDNSPRRLDVLKQLDSVKDLLGLRDNSPLSRNAELQQALFRSCFVSAFAILEGYLESVFKHYVLSNDEAKVKLALHQGGYVNDGMQKECVDMVLSGKADELSLKRLQDEYKKKVLIPGRVDKALEGIVFHRIDKIDKMFSAVAHINVYGEHKERGSWFRSLDIRNDCVHRAGFDKQGKPINLTAGDCFELIGRIASLVDSVEAKMKTILV